FSIDQLATERVQPGLLPQCPPIKRIDEALKTKAVSELVSNTVEQAHVAGRNRPLQSEIKLGPLLHARGAVKLEQNVRLAIVQIDACQLLRQRHRVNLV